MLAEGIYISSTSHKLRKRIFLMFAAGADTSRLTLDWFVQLMALHPTIQDKLYQEIESNVGKARNIIS